MLVLHLLARGRARGPLVYKWDGGEDGGEDGGKVVGGLHCQTLQ